MNINLMSALRLKLVGTEMPQCFIMHKKVLTPITLMPLIDWCLGCPWGTQPATTKCLSSSCALLIAFLKLSSDGFFTVQLLRSHRSAASESSTIKRDKTTHVTELPWLYSRIIQTQMTDKEGGHGDLLAVLRCWCLFNAVNKISTCEDAVISNPTVCHVCAFHAAVFRWN